MAVSTTPRPTASNPCGPALQAWQARHPFPTSGNSSIGVAYSGGADSTALLLAAQARWSGRVVALHVNHGLQAAAADFELHAQAFCATHGIELAVAHARARPARGDSPEDAARRARYTALAAMARQRGITDVLLAQHADDQVETLLLALSRGAGLPGLAAMPATIEREGVRFHRPVLALPGAEIRAWLVDAGVPHVIDPSNAAPAFTRNRIRARLLPALDASFVGWRDTFARSSRHAAEAQGLLDGLAHDDLQAVGVPPRLAGLRQLPRARQSNLLRHWLASSHDARPSAAQLTELLDQIEACRTRGHRIELRVGAGRLRREGDVLAWYNCAS
jgi:tRNA(Ile)-lysidine synthase